MVARRVLLIAAASVLAACQHAEDRHLKRTVSRDELIGTWRATEGAMQDMRNLGVRDHLSIKDHTLNLAADGSCTLRTFTAMPDEGSVDYRVYDRGCRWKLGHAGDQSLDFELDPPPTFGLSYFFAEENGRLLLWQYADDPDSWRYMEFEKGRE